MEQIALQHPQSVQELTTIKGIGMQKVKNYGECIVNACAF